MASSNDVLLVRRGETGDGAGGGSHGGGHTLLTRELHRLPVTPASIR